jgi:serine/threonine protein kinase
MSTDDPDVSAGPGRQVETLERWLAAFDLSWHEGALLEHAARLPADGPMRRQAIVEMIKIDLERRAQRGQTRSLTDYLHDFPELATDGGTVDELRRVEQQVQEAFSATGDFNAPLSDTLNSQTAKWPGITTADSPGPTLSGRFGRYRIVRPLGHGGMGRVYLAHDDRLDRPVALKIPRPDVLNDPATVARFLREAKAAAALSHPNLCQVYDADWVGECHYIAMAYVDGRPLTDLIDPSAPLAVDRAVGLVVVIARAMAFAHARGVIHRDLKPSNVMITQTGEPVVMDFGLARRVHRPEERLTHDGSFLGTPAYMPPEQINGEIDSIGPASDVYSLGIILYELLTGRPPFRGSFGEVINRALNELPVSPSRLRPGLDPRLETVCLKALAKRPADRYARMDAFGAAMEESVRRNPPPTRRWLWPSVAAIVTAAILMVVVSRWRDPGEKENAPLPEPEPPNRLPINPPQSDPNPKDGTLQPLASIEKKRLKLPGQFKVKTVGFGSPGQVLTAGGETVRAWSLDTGQEVETARLAYGVNTSRVAFQTNGTHVVWDRSYNLDVINLRTLEPVNSIHCESCTAIAFSSNGRRVASGGAPDFAHSEAPVGVWVIESKQVFRLRGLRHEVVSVAVTADGRQAITAGEDGIHWFDVDGETELGRLDLPASRSVALIGDGTRAVIAQAAGSLALWDLTTRQKLRDFDGHTASVICLAVSGDQRWLLSGSDDTTARVWDIASGKQLACLTGHADSVTCVAFSADPTQCLTGGGKKDNTARYWKLKGTEAD